MRRNWIAVASAEHVARGRADGYMQVCHGKAAPLRRLRPGDRVVYYSPTAVFGGKLKLQEFTALGIVAARATYQFQASADSATGFCPHRRDVDWLVAQSTRILPLLEHLEFSAGKTNWGYQFRFGIFSISDHDMQLIARSMQADLFSSSCALLAMPFASESERTTRVPLSGIQLSLV
ncbi:EVE domain-containing protein [Undibacterium sp. Ren11W]|uniref:EVE domain-containing protein n=1 Tax=Undibacterium sp. Ren11W TaxID=3413045 RepID=UPI003BF31FA9